MTTLREEIYLRIRQSFPDNNPNTIAFVSRKITEIIEKRIKEIPMKHDSNTVEEVNYTNGWNDAKREVRMKLT